MAYGFYLYWIALVFLLLLLLIFNVQSVADVRLYFGFAIKSNCLLWYQRTWTIMSLKNNNLLLYSTVNSYTVLFLCKKKIYSKIKICYSQAVHTTAKWTKHLNPFFQLMTVTMTYPIMFKFYILKMALDWILVNFFFSLLQQKNFYNQLK